METSVPPPPLPPPTPSSATSAPGPAPVARVPLFAGGVRRPGQLTPGWRVVVLATWVLAILAETAVWKASRELGLSTWWLGPVAAARPVPILLLPFVAPVAMIVATLNNARRLPWYGLAASAAAAAIAVGDLDQVRRLGFVELVIALACAAVSVASLGGRYRSSNTDRPPAADPAGRLDG